MKQQPFNIHGNIKFHKLKKKNYCVFWTIKKYTYVEYINIFIKKYICLIIKINYMTLNLCNSFVFKSNSKYIKLMYRELLKADNKV